MAESPPQDDAPRTKRRYRPAARLQLPERDTDLAYLVGLMDGEGCITRKAQGKGGWIVSCAMADKEVIDYLASLGGAVYERPPGHSHRFARKLQWHLMRQRDVIAFLEAILPYMKLQAKIDKATAAIAELRERAEKRPSRNTGRLCPCTNIVTRTDVRQCNRGYAP